MDDRELRSWIETTTGRTVREVERMGYGASRATFIVAMADGGDLVARVDTGDGPMAATELSLGREAEVYRALADTPVRIPAMHGVAPDGRVLLAERAPGTHVIDDLPEGERHAVLDDYIDALADLHLVAAASLDLPSYRRPVDAPDHARQELDLWGTILETRTTKPWPLAHYTRAVLHQCAPTTVARTVLCHGDVGPGNFLHDSGRVTALLDWEFSHLGDPMDDLGWWVFRGHDMAGGCGDLAAQLARWSARTGLPVDSASIEYYRAFVMFRWLVSVAATLDRGGSGIDRSVHFALVPILAVRLPQALATLVGTTLPPPPATPDDAPGPAADVLAALAADLTEVILPGVESPEAQRRARAALLYVSHLMALDRLGPALAEAELDDLAEVLGHRPATAAEGHAELAASIREAIEPPDLAGPDLLGYFWRAGHRQIALWPLAAPKALSPATSIPGSLP